MATKQMVVMLIQKDLIKYGLKNKSFLFKTYQSNQIARNVNLCDIKLANTLIADNAVIGKGCNNNYLNTFQTNQTLNVDNNDLGLNGADNMRCYWNRCGEQSNGNNMSSENMEAKKNSEERNRRLKKELKRFSKRMQEDLRDDNFVSAVQSFCQILNNKVPDWNEIAQIWSYAVLNRNIQYIKAILDLIQHKRVIKNYTDEEDLNFYANTQNSLAMDEDQSILQNNLKFKYGFGRIRTQNPYDIIDSKNYEINSADFSQEIKLASETDLVDPLKFNISLDDFSSSLTITNDNDFINLIGLDEYEKMSKIDFNDASNLQDEFFTMGDLNAFKCDLKIDQTTSKEFKEPNMNYLSLKLLNEMYDMLVFSGDMCFSLQASEMLYSRTKLTDEDFINPYACYYYSHRKNVMMNELFESVYQIYQNRECNLNGLVTAKGTLEKVGYKFKQQVLEFTSQDKDNSSF